MTGKTWPKYCSEKNTTVPHISFYPKNENSEVARYLPVDVAGVPLGVRAAGGPLLLKNFLCMGVTSGL